MELAEFAETHTDNLKPMEYAPNMMQQPSFPSLKTDNEIHCCGSCKYSSNMEFASVVQIEISSAKIAVNKRNQ